MSPFFTARGSFIFIIAYCTSICKSKAAPFIENKKKIYNRQLNENRENLFIKIDDINDKEKLERIENILKLYPGNEQVFLCTTVPKKKYRWNGNVTISKVLVDNLKQILNENCIKIVTQ